jgi:uncharacterized membrane protein
MTRNRLEAFTDGVLAIVITIMVLELPVPPGHEWHDFWLAGPKYVAYILSFIYIGIYWNNHHHLMHAVERVDGGVLWANMHLLFWLSIVPFTTAWLGESHGAKVPTVLYGISLFLAAIAYTILVQSIIREQLRHSGGQRSRLRDVVGNDSKGYVSLACYAAGIGLSYVDVRLGWALYATVAIIWLVPDRRVTRALGD